MIKWSLLLRVEKVKDSEDAKSGDLIPMVNVAIINTKLAEFVAGADEWFTDRLTWYQNVNDYVENLRGVRTVLCEESVEVQWISDAEGTNESQIDEFTTQLNEVNPVFIDIIDDEYIIGLEVKSVHGKIIKADIMKIAMPKSDGPMYDTIQEQREKVNKRITSMKSTQKELNNNRQVCEQRINDGFKDIVKSANKRRAELLTELETITNNTRSKLNESVKQLNEFYKKTEGTPSTVDAVQFTGILAESRKLLNKHKDVNIIYKANNSYIKNEISRIALFANVNVLSLSQVKKEEEKSERISSDQKEKEKSAPVMKLFCALCVESRRLRWPLVIENIGDKPAKHSYTEELKQFIEDPEHGSQYKRDVIKFGSIAGKALQIENTKQTKECTHVAGFGEVYCQHCGKNVTDKFDPRTWKCPKCNVKLHGAISSARCIKVH